LIACADRAAAARASANAGVLMTEIASRPTASVCRISSAILFADKTLPDAATRSAPSGIAEMSSAALVISNEAAPASTNSQYCDENVRRGWCPEAGSNHRHCDFQSHALPTELSGHLLTYLTAGFGGSSLAKRAGYST
jgi:hypothetical protein